MIHWSSLVYVSILRQMIGSECQARESCQFTTSQTTKISSSPPLVVYLFSPAAAATAAACCCCRSIEYSINFCCCIICCWARRAGLRALAAKKREIRRMDQGGGNERLSKASSLHTSHDESQSESYGWEIATNIEKKWKSIGSCVSVSNIFLVSPQIKSMQLLFYSINLSLWWKARKK